MEAADPLLRTLVLLLRRSAVIAAAALLGWLVVRWLGRRSGPGG